MSGFSSARAAHLFTLCTAIVIAFQLALVAMVLIVRARAGLYTASGAARLGKLGWLVVAYCGLGVLANAATPSAAERMLWLPVVSLMFVSSLRVVRTRAPTSPRGTA